MHDRFKRKDNYYAQRIVNEWIAWRTSMRIYCRWNTSITPGKSPRDAIIAISANYIIPNAMETIKIGNSIPIKTKIKIKCLNSFSYHTIIVRWLRIEHNVLKSEIWDTVSTCSRFRFRCVFTSFRYLSIDNLNSVPFSLQVCHEWSSLWNKVFNGYWTCICICNWAVMEAFMTIFVNAM